MAGTNPFIILEAAMEHTQNARINNTVSEVAYHLEAVEDGLGRLFQALVLLLPGAYAAYEGEPTDTIISQIEGGS